MAAVGGAYDMILKDAAVEVLVQSLQQVADGLRLLPLPSSDQASREPSAAAENAPKLPTERERQIMRSASEGLSNKEIARRLNIADRTIKVHLHKMFGGVSRSCEPLLFTEESTRLARR